MADSNICFLWFSAALHPTLWFCKQRKLCWCCWWHTALSSPSCILKCVASGSHLLFCPATSVEFRYEKRFRKAFPRWLLLYVSMVHYCDISSEGLAEVWHYGLPLWRRDAAMQNSCEWSSWDRTLCQRPCRPHVPSKVSWEKCTQSRRGLSHWWPFLRSYGVTCWWEQLEAGLSMCLQKSCCRFSQMGGCGFLT